MNRLSRHPVWNRGTLRTRLALVMVVSLLPLVAVFAIQARDSRRQSADQAAENTLLMAVSAANDVNARLDAAQAVLTGVGARVAPGTAAERCDELVERLDAGLDTVSYAFGLDGTGRILCSSHAIDRSVDVSDRTWFTDALVTGFGRGVEVSGPLAAEPVLVATASTPGHGGCVMGVAIDASRELPSSFERIGLPEGSTLRLVDSQGRIVDSVPAVDVGEQISSRALIGRLSGPAAEGTMQARGRDGAERIFSYASVEGTDQAVYALVGIPLDQAHAEADRRLRNSIIALVGVAALGLALALAVGELAVARGTSTLLGAVRRMGRGDLGARTGVQEGGELGELARAVDTMAVDLQERQSRLLAATEERERLLVEREQLLVELLDAQEEERKRIAADIHDDTIQAIVAVGLQVSLIRRDVGDPVLATRMGVLEATVSRAVANLRQLMFELEPAALERGLDIDIEAYLGSMFATEGIEVEVEVDVGGVGEPHGGARQVLFRNLREAALNAARHGASRTIAVRLEAVDGGMLVRVEDDGCGFGAGEEKKPGHHGLRTMRERSERLGGWLTLASQPGAGTIVTFWLP